MPGQAAPSRNQGNAGQAIAALDDRGRWLLPKTRLDDEKKTPVLDNVTDTGVFDSNVRTLCSYLEAVSPASGNAGMK